MDKMIARFPGQLEEMAALAKTLAFEKAKAPIRTVFISGLGGSGIGGNFVQEFTRSVCKAPITVSKGYTIPEWINKHTLAICSSYSGNTEETLSAFHQLLKTGATIVCIASGGKLLELANNHGCSVVKVPGGWSSPRACLGFSVGAQLAVLQHFRLISTAPFRQFTAAAKMLARSQPAIQKRARQIAQFLAGKMPVIYAPDTMEAVAVRWRQQINENAKMLCWHHVLPEMNHNELVGWTQKDPTLAVVWLRNHDDHPRTAIRTDITKEIVEHFTGSSISIFSNGKNNIEKALYFVHLGDWMSFYLAELQGADPVEIKVIDFLKQELGKVK